MGYQTSTGRTLLIDQSFTLNGERFPSNWLRVNYGNAAEMEKRGISIVDDPVSKLKDDKWYSNRTTPDGEVSSTPWPIDELRAREVKFVKDRADSLLSSSDWMVIRQAEAGKGILPQWADYRAAVRAASDVSEEAINAADFEAIQKLEYEWPKRPE